MRVQIISVSVLAYCVAAQDGQIDWLSKDEIPDRLCEAGDMSCSTFGMGATLGGEPGAIDWMTDEERPDKLCEAGDANCTSGIPTPAMPG